MPKLYKMVLRLSKMLLIKVGDFASLLFVHRSNHQSFFLRKPSLKSWKVSETTKKKTMSLRPSVRPSVRLSVCLQVYPSVCTSVLISVCLSVNMQIFSL